MHNKMLVVFSMMLIVGCAGQDSEERTDSSVIEKQLSTQFDAMEKAKAVESEMLQADQKRRAAIDEN